MRGNSNRRRDQSTIALAVIVGLASGALAATKKQHSTNPTWDVYDNRGVYIGSDPDPRVRMQLLFQGAAE